MSGVTRRPLPAVVPSSWLRVYEPIDRFPPAERRRWAALVAAGCDGSDAWAQRADQVERALAWRRLASGAAASAGPPATARVLRPDGAVLVCPVPPDGRALTRAWRAPVAWLALVREADRVPGPPGRYQVPMSNCRARSAQALRTLLGALGEGGVAEGVARTSAWLEGWDAGAWVELDARSVVALVDSDGADDVRMGLEALGDGDATGVAAAYRRINRRDQRLDDLSISS